MTAPATPQLEDGYTRIANELLEALGRIRIPGEARQVLDVILRKTYGFNKKADQISTSQFTEATGLVRQHVTRGVRTLEALNLILVTSNGASSPPTYRVNKSYQTWRPESKKVRGVVTGPRIKKDSDGIKKDSAGESNTVRDGIKKDSEANQKRFQSESNTGPTKDIERKKDNKDKTTTTAEPITVRELSILYQKYAGMNITSPGLIVVLQDICRDFTRDTIIEAFQAAAAQGIRAQSFLNWAHQRMKRRLPTEQNDDQADRFAFLDDMGGN